MTPSQEQPPRRRLHVPTQTTNIKAVGRVILSVADQDRSIEFYVDTLGFELRSDIPFGNGDRWVEVAPPSAETTIALAIPPGGLTQKPTTSTCVALTTDDVSASRDVFVERGVECDDLMGGDGTVPAMFFFSDPDGNRLLLVEDRPM